MKKSTRICLSLSLVLMVAGHGLARADGPDIERGRYLVKIGGCNDCHTTGFAESMGQTPETEWLTGSDVGFSGPWGVSYATNLRLAAKGMTRQQWQARITAGGLPPMPWPSLQAMTQEDQAAMLAYIQSLGARGVPAPAALPPGAPINTLHIPFVPQGPTAKLGMN